MCIRKPEGIQLAVHGDFNSQNDNYIIQVENKMLWYLPQIIPPESWINSLGVPQCLLVAAKPLFKINLLKSKNSLWSSLSL